MSEFKNIELPCFGIVLTKYGIKSDLTKECETNEERAAMDAIESIILAHHSAGIDVSTKEYIIGIETAVDACYNNL